MRTIKFNRDFPKLSEFIFTRIKKVRKIKEEMKKYVDGEIYRIKTPTREFKAMLLSHNVFPLLKLSESLLMFDTDTETYEEALIKLKISENMKPENVKLMVMVFENMDEIVLGNFYFSEFST